LAKRDRGWRSGSIWPSHTAERLRCDHRLVGTESTIEPRGLTKRVFGFSARAGSTSSHPSATVLGSAACPTANFCRCEVSRRFQLRQLQADRLSN
jgi:hypothetical protein